MHQWEALLRVVYSNEVLGKTEIGAKGLLLSIATATASHRAIVGCARLI